MEIFVLCAIALLVTAIIFRRIIEPAYMLLFNKPVYVHFYLFPKKLSPAHAALLEKEFPFYKNLPPARKSYFQHRTQSFIGNYTFLGRDGLEVTDDMKLRIAAIWVMLTFGMRNYLTKIFAGIIIYPDVFISKDGNYHKGEFNPAARAVVFSWKHFLEGLEFNNDNINLGLHEFAHALHFDSVARRRPGSSAIIYSDMFNEIMRYINNPVKREELAAINYFRLYAYTNQYEFIAVILEYFFETPKEFRQKLPELYQLVKKMINFSDK